MENNNIIIDRDEYERLIITAYAFDFLTDSLFINASLGYADNSLYFSIDRINDVLRVMAANRYDARLAELIAAKEAQEAK